MVKVNEIRKDFLQEEKRVDMPSGLKQQVIDEIVELLRSLKSSNATVQNGGCDFGLLSLFDVLLQHRISTAFLSSVYSQFCCSII